GRPSSPPSLLVSSAQICIASSPEVPLTASPPVNGMLKPIVIGCPDGASAKTAVEADIVIATAAATAAPADLSRVLCRNIFPPEISYCEAIISAPHARPPPAPGRR